MFQEVLYLYLSRGVPDVQRESAERLLNRLLVTERDYLGKHPQDLDIFTIPRLSSIERSEMRHIGF